MPTPEPGVRPSRALPYEFVFTDAVLPLAVVPTLALTLSATGTAAGAFQQYNWALPDLAPRRYAVTPGATITDTFNATAFAADGSYGLAVHGANGWVRALTGNLTLAAAPASPGEAAEPGRRGSAAAPVPSFARVQRRHCQSPTTGPPSGR